MVLAQSLKESDGAASRKGKNKNILFYLNFFEDKSHLLL